MTGMARHIKHPGIRGGRFYFDKHGNVRYGENPALTRKVRRISFKPTAEGKNPFEGQMLAPTWDVLRIARVQSPSEIRKFLFETFWASMGYTEEQKQERWEDFVQQLWDQDAATFQMDEAEEPAGAAIVSSQVPSSVVHAPVTGTRTTRTTPAATDDEPKWETLVNPGVVAAPKFKPLGLKVKYNGRNIALTPQAEEYAVLFARLIPRKDDNLKDIWGEICTNFALDFGPAIGIPDVDVSRVDFSAVSKRMALEKERKDKLPKKPKVKPDPKKTPELYAIADGKSHLVGKITLPGTSIYIGAHKGQGVGRVIHGRKVTDVTLNGTKFPKKWKGKTTHEPTRQWVAKYENPHTGQTEYVGFAKSSEQKQRVSSAVKWEDLKVVSDLMPTVRSAYIRALHSPDAKEREIAFLVMLADTMHARIGKEGTGTSKGLVQLNAEELRADGSYHFYGKDNVLWDSNYKIKAPYTNKPVQMNRAAMVATGAHAYDARPVYAELARGKHPRDPLFSVKGSDVNAWLKKVTNNEVITIHKFRHYHGTKYWVSEWDKHKHKLDALKTAGTLTDADVRALADHCSVVAAVKLGHRRTESKKAKEKRLASEAAKRAAGKTVKKKAHTVGSATTRTSYLDFEIVLGHTLKYGVDVRSKPEQRDTAHWLDKKFQRQLDRIRGKATKAFRDIEDLYKGMLLETVDLREDPNPVIPDPDCPTFSERVLKEVLDEKAEQEWGGLLLAKAFRFSKVATKTGRTSRRSMVAEIQTRHPGEDLHFAKPSSPMGRGVLSEFADDHFAHALHGAFHIRPYGSRGYVSHYYPGGWHPMVGGQERPLNRFFVSRTGRKINPAHRQRADWSLPESAVYSTKREAITASLRLHNSIKTRKPESPAIIHDRKPPGAHRLFTELHNAGLISSSWSGGAAATHAAIKEMFADKEMGKNDLEAMWQLPEGYHHHLLSAGGHEHTEYGSGAGEEGHVFRMDSRIVESKSGLEAGTMDRKFISVPGDRHVYHASMFMNDNHQGHGFAKTMLGSAYRSYIKHGFDRVDVGPVSIGKYAWPKGGFDFAHDSARQYRQRALRDWLLHGRGFQGPAFSEAEADKIVSGMRYAWDFASLDDKKEKRRTVLDHKWEPDSSQEGGRWVAIRSYLLGKRFLLDSLSSGLTVNLKTPDGSDPDHAAQHDYLRSIKHLD